MEFAWKNIDVTLGSQKIENITSISYTSEEYKTLLFQIESGIKMERIPSMEFYLKRKNKYYFKNSFGVKFCLVSNENMLFKKGDKINIEF